MHSKRYQYTTIKEYRTLAAPANVYTWSATGISTGSLIIPNFY